ncbi:MAG: bifunctional diaminohydroxyphosphoribosylaminopyrimidine deaminase/5-amino-6-(5-phosphoribosylamino)uracil reductase RibD [Candidatus Latescibacterota bacterium]|jgi:diaminohydroxyphosphoribosylaminopyrimidine deaminase/5-amino-6-(5-phosphoribosylamino)uracil reductase
MVKNPDSPSIAGSSARATSFDWVDEAFMTRALELAWQAAGRTNPNPVVGAVVVRDGSVVGEGYHHRCGDAHAEVEALTQAADRARDATMYVTLEPCAHHGRTPPCAERLVDTGVKRVVIPALDPDHNVRGRGVSALRAAGIRVDIGCCETAAIATNVGYYKHRLGLGPTVILKMALTMDGRIAAGPGRRDKITGDAAHRYVHRLRSNSDGIVVGLDTVRTDDPVLDCRLADCGVQPLPVVLDGDFQLPADNRWARENRPYIVVGSETGAYGDVVAAEHRAGGGQVLRCAADGSGRVDVDDAVGKLSEIGLNRLLVEGGAHVFTSFIRAGRWDAMFLFHSPKAFGKRGIPVYASDEGLTPDTVPVDAVRLEHDFLHRYLNKHTREEIISGLSSMD